MTTLSDKTGAWNKNIVSGCMHLNNFGLVLNIT